MKSSAVRVGVALSLVAVLLASLLQAVGIHRASAANATVTAELSADGNTIVFTSAAQPAVGETLTVINNTGITIVPDNSLAGSLQNAPGGGGLLCTGLNQATCSVFAGATKNFGLATTGNIKFISGGAQNGVLSFGGGGGAAGPATIVKGSLDPDGGTCTWRGQALSKKEDFFFVDFKYAPGPSECSKEGFTLTGWSDDNGTTLPLLNDGGVPRYFIGQSADYKAIWKPPPVLTLVENTDGFIFQAVGSTYPLWCGEPIPAWGILKKCSSNVDAGSNVTIGATPSGTKYLAAWGGSCAGTSTTSACTLTVTESVTVSATFADNRLSVTKTGSGTGVVQSFVKIGETLFAGSLVCGATCSANHFPGSTVVLGAVADARSTFKAWGGACAGTPMTSTCSVTMNQAKNVTAEFEKDGLEVTINAPRYGLVASLSPLIFCGRFFGEDATTCSAKVKPGDSMELFAAFDPVNTTVTWSQTCGTVSTTGFVSACKITVPDNGQAPVTVKYECKSPYRSDFEIRGRRIGAGADLSGEIFGDLDNLQNACLIGANLNGANLYNATLTGANLTGANLASAKLTKANLDGANLTGATLTKANLAGATLTKANLAGANLTGATLSATLTNGTLTKANLDGANLTGANLTGADLVFANLTGANLTGANLTGADCELADLINANLINANLTDANLVAAGLTGANLTSANLTSANLTGANLTGANLTGANLTGALLFTNLTGANLTGANLTNARGYRR